MFESSRKYICSLTLEDGTPILKSKNKTGFLGFVIAMESFRAIYTEYCETVPLLLSIYTYRFSQDHLEMFFGSIRTITRTPVSFELATSGC